MGYIKWKTTSSQLLKEDGPYKLSSNFLTLNIFQDQRENIVPSKLQEQFYFKMFNKFNMKLCNFSYNKKPNDLHSLSCYSEFLY